MIMTTTDFFNKKYPLLACGFPSASSEEKTETLQIPIMTTTQNDDATISTVFLKRSLSLLLPPFE